MASSCLLAGGGRPGEGSGGLQQAGSAGAGNAPDQEQAEPATAEDFLKKGNEYARLNKWKEAEEAYRKALGLKSDYPQAHYNLAMPTWLNNAPPTPSGNTRRRYG